MKTLYHLLFLMLLHSPLSGCGGVGSNLQNEDSDVLDALADEEVQHQERNVVHSDLHLAVSRFIDISGDSRESEIHEALQRGLVTGFPGGEFRPDNALSREELSAILFNALGQFGLKAPPVSTIPKFSDVSVSRWSYRAIDALAQYGIVSGLPGGKFNPSAQVTRSQTVTMVLGLISKARAASGKPTELPSIVARRQYSDAQGHWSQAAVWKLSGYCRAENGNDQKIDRFNPEGLSTRSHGVGALMRALICFQTGALPAWSKDSKIERPVPIDAAQILDLCDVAPGSKTRVLALEKLKNFELGQSSLSFSHLSQSHEKCVLGLLPAALYTNMKTGVAASILVGQAIQETGWCKSELARIGSNFHGQKAKFNQSYFKYWAGQFVSISSSESSTGSGNRVTSDFMKFSHPDYSFYSVAERFRIPGLAYNSCTSLRENAESFVRCIGRSWAVHKDYADVVLGHRQRFRSQERPSLRLAQCDLKRSEWELDPDFESP